MPTTAAFCPLSLDTVFDANACPIRGARLFAFDATTTNPRPLYQDAGLTSVHPVPVLADAFGRLPAMWVDVGAYKLVLQDQNGAQLALVDGLPGGVASAAPSTTAATVIPTGFVMAAHTDDVADGWLPLNAQTIGNATSGATARANSDTQALFTKLWNKDASLPVSGGRGVSATSDFGAGKTLALPDYRGRAVVGLDGMGSSRANVLSALTTPTGDTLGTDMGLETVALGVSQLPVFTPTVSVAAAGGFTPAGTIDQQGQHAHAATTDTQGDHFHNVQTVPVNTQAGGNSAAIQGGSTSPQATSTNGAHSHGVTVQTNGLHTHNFAGTAVGPHTHTATAAQIGGGGAHGNVQPSILAYYNIKL